MAINTLFMTYEHCVRDIQTLPEHFFFDFIYVLNDACEKLIIIAPSYFCLENMGESDILTDGK